jgi:hypothetical protein
MVLSIITANLRIPLFAGAGAMLLGVVFLCVFFFVGGGSRGAWTSLAAVLGASVALAINLRFDLRGSKDITRITTEYTFDHAVPQLRQWMYPRSLGDRYATEVLANYAALQANPSIFEGDREKLTKDMILFSLIVYLETRQHDWQMEERHYATSTSTITTMQNKSNPENTAECTKISYDYIMHMLTAANNAFALTRPITPFSYLCLPPQSSVRLDQSSITLRNPFCTILFSTEPGFLELRMMQPGSHTADVPALPDGKPRFETRVIGLQVTRKMSWVTAQHQDFVKYEKWCKGVVDGARAWFETKTTDESGPPWFGDDGEGEGGMFWAGTTDKGPITIRGSTIYRQSPE